MHLIYRLVPIRWNDATLTMRSFCKLFRKKSLKTSDCTYSVSMLTVHNVFAPLSRTKSGDVPGQPKSEDRGNPCRLTKVHSDPCFAGSKLVYRRRKQVQRKLS